MGTLVLLSMAAVAGEPQMVLRKPWGDLQVRETPEAVALRNQLRDEQQERESISAVVVRDEVAELLRQLGPKSWVTTCNLLSLVAAHESAAERAARTSALARLSALESAFARDATAIAARLARQEASGGAAGQGAQRELAALRKRREAIEALLQQARAGLNSTGSGLGGRLAEELRACTGRDVRGTLHQAVVQLDSWGQSNRTPVLGVGQLSYLNAPAGSPPPLPNGRVTAAYTSAGAGALAPEDTTQGREIVLSQEVTAKATELGSPAAIVDFVKHAVRLEWGYGAMKGTDVTLREGVGTQAEIAGLVIALLRAREVPARYVTGTVQWPAERLAGAMGLLASAEADALDSGATVVLDATRRARMLEVLSAAGIPFQTLGTDVRFGHVWVEAWIPWGSYRGAAVGDEARQWVPIEASLWGAVRASRSPSRTDAWAGIGGAADSITQAYLARTRGQTFQSYTRGLVETWAGASNPNAWAQASGRRVVERTEHLDLIPGSLPYEVVSVDGEAAFLPDGLLHQVKLELRSGAAVLLSSTVPSHQLVSRRAVFTFKPATPVDEVLRDASGGLYASSPSALNLLPTLRVNGVELVAGTASATLGTPTSFSLELRAPGASVRRVENALVVGNVTALGLAAPGNVFVEGAYPGDTDGRAEKFLYARAASYATGWTRAEDAFANLLDVRLVRPSPSLVLASNQLRVEETLGVRSRVTWKGVQIDADLRTTIPVSDVRARVTDFMKLSGFEGSALEATVLTDGTGEDAISTTGVLQEAAAQGVAALVIEASNASSVLPTLTASSEVSAEVQAAIALGRQVRIPQRPLTVANWTGTGFIVRNLQSEESSYFLSGVVSGGQTIISPQFWTDQSLVQDLSNPGLPEAITDLTRIARIVKGGLTTQHDSIDVLTPRSLTAFVTAADGTRISGATVTFSAIGASQARFPSAGQLCPGTRSASDALPTTKSVETDASGAAKVLVCPDPNLLAFGWLEQPPTTINPGPEAALVGLTAIQAAVALPFAPPAPESIQLAIPFALSSSAGAVAALEADDPAPPPGQVNQAAEGLSLLNATVVRVSDRFGNPVANNSVLWEQGSAAGAFRSEVISQRSDAVVRDPLDATQLPTITVRASTQGFAVVRYIAPFGAQTVLLSARSGSLIRPFQPINIFSSTVNDLRLRTDFAPSSSVGTAGTEMPAPFKVRVWKRTASTWVPVQSADVGSYQATLVSRSSTAVLGTTTVAANEQTFPAIGDDADTIVVWPRFAPNFSGIQTDTLTVRVGSTVVGELTATSTVRPAVARALARRLGEPARALPFPIGFVQPDDVSAGFVVENPGSTPLFVEFELLGSAHLGSPGNSPLPVPAALPLATAVPGLSTIQLLRVVEEERKGFVRPRVYASKPSAGPTAFELLADPLGPNSLQPSFQIVSTAPAITVTKLESAEIAFPVRSPRTQRTAPAVEAVPPSPPAVAVPVDDLPILTNGKLRFTVNVSGDVFVRRSGLVVAQGRVATVLGVPFMVTEITPGTLTLTLDGPLLEVSLPPGGLTGDALAVELQPVGGGPLVSEALTLKTEVRDLGVMPLGHTFVKDVNVATGALVKQFNDISIPGRGNALSFSRTYASNNHEVSRLGIGWNHSWNSYLQRAPGGASSNFRMIVVGGSGGGQVFACAESGPNPCVAQAGYHGTLTVSSPPLRPYWEFRTKGGVRYRYSDRLDGDGRAARHRLESVVDPAGYETELRYASLEAPGELSGVVEPLGANPADRRALHFRYQTLPTAGRRLKSVELVLAEGGASLGACVAFQYWPVSGHLTTATRAKTCDGSGTNRTESFEYLNPVTLGARANADSNLKAYIDFRGNKTEYRWLTVSDPVASENAFVFFDPAAKVERVKSVTEPAPAGGVTTFMYSLAEASVSTDAPPPVLGGPPVPATRLLFKTVVRPARADMQASEGETIYSFDAYGAGAETSRPLTAATRAVSKQVFGDTHQLEYEVDARGRKTVFTYDNNGNLASRRTLSAPLTSTVNGSPALPQAEDESGAPVDASVEVWSYDNFSQWTRHEEPHRLGQPAARIESRLTDADTGRVLEHTRGTVGAPEAATRRFRYHGVNGTAVLGSSPGDLVASVDGNGNETRVESFDSYGNPLLTRVVNVAGALTAVNVATTNVFDTHSRLRETSDTIGHHTETAYDDLDRPTSVERFNTKHLDPADPSPGSLMTYTYFPGGQLLEEANVRTGLVRTHQLDELNRVVSVTESGGGLSASLVTSNAYDKHGNVTARVDRRGVATITQYDFADRPVSTIACVGSSARYAAQGGVSGTVGQTPSTTAGCEGQGGTVSTVTYDDVGNKQAETNAQGHTTTFGYDALYRAIAVSSPPVPGADLTSGLISWTTTRRFDLAGRTVRETDGNGKSSVTAYDALGRLSSSTDALGRVTARTYDDNDNVTSESFTAGGVTHRATTAQFDALNRAVHSVITAAPAISYTSDTRYNDSLHTVAMRDARGFVSLQKLDDLDRVFELQVDVASANGLNRGTQGDVLLATSLGLTTGAAFDANGNKRLALDAEGRRTVAAFDGLNRLLTRQSPMGVVESFTTYSGEGQLLEWTDARGFQHRAKFDVLGRQRQTSIDESLSNAGNELLVSRTDYVDAADGERLNRRDDTDARGNITSTFTDALGRVARVRDPFVNGVQHQTQTHFDAKVKRVDVDRKGFVTRFSYDDVYRLTSQTDRPAGASSGGLSQSWAFNDTLRRTTQVDRSVVTTVAEADGLGRVVTTTRGPAGLQQVVSHTFDPDGRETQTTDANTHVTKRVFDGAGRQVREARGLLSSCVDPCPGREEVVSKYDAVGNLLEAKSLRVTGADYDVRNTWDDLNRNVRMEDALGNVTSKAYDAAGNLLCVKAPKGSGHQGHGWAGGRTLAQLEAVACPGTNVTRYRWDELGKQMSVQDANGSLWQFRYDETRNLVAKLDANAHLTTYRFDARNQRTEELQHLGNGQTLPSRNALPSFVAPNAGFTTGTLGTRWTYDANGQMEDEVDAKGQLKHHVYGLLKRLDTVTYSGHVAPRALPSIDSIGYTYRGEGELDTCTEAKTTASGAVTEVTRHFYDRLERRNRTQRYDGYETTYGYDVKGNRTLVRDADGVETAYTYDTVDRLSSATTPVGTTTYAYWEDGLLKTTRYGATMTESRSYDAASRLTVVEAVAPSRVPPLVSRFDYAYDANGNRESQVETRGLAGETTTYGYDEADRLIGVAYPAETHLYQVDAVGNRTGEKRAAAGVVAALTVAAFAALSPAVASAAVERQHNAVDWVTAVVDVKASTTTALSYDANGNRTGEGTKQYAWDIRDTLTRASDGATVLGTYDYDAKLQRVKADTTQGHVEYVLDGKYVLREAGARSRRYHFGEGEALAVTGVGGTSAQDSWLLIDGLGSVVTEANATASSVTARQFDAWGNYRNNTAPTANETRLGYTGHQFDVETGLTYARARYYDSKLGVFLSRDSFEGVLSDAPSLHRFAYSHNNPLKYVDPSGRCVLGIGGKTCGERASDWEESRAEYRKWLANELTGEVTTGQAALLVVPTLAVELGAGLVDLGRLGEGSAEGSARGYFSDAVRAVGAFLMLKGLARSSPKPVGEAPPVEPVSAPVETVVVEAPAPPTTRPAPPSPVDFARARGAVVDDAVGMPKPQPVNAAESVATPKPEPTVERVEATGPPAQPTYVIQQGVRRAKAALMTGKDTVPAVIQGQGETVVRLPIESLRSPKPYIDAASTAFNKDRWLQNNLKPASGPNPSEPPPLEVRPGTSGTPIKDVDVVLNPKDPRLK